MSRSSFLPIFTLFILGCVQANDQNPIKKAFFRGEYERTVSLAKQRLIENENDPEALTFYGQSLVKLQQFEDAIPILNRAIDLDGSFPARKAWGLLHRGEAHYCLGYIPQAKADLTEITRIKSRALEKANYKLVVYGLLPSFDSWTLIETEHIRFHFQPGSIIPDLDKWAESRQLAFRNINLYFEVTLPKKIDFFVWNSNEGAKAVIYRTLGFAMPNECIIHSRTNQTRGHELTHIVTAHVIENQKQNRLINEGFAVFFDQSNRDNFDSLGQYIKTEGNKRVSINEIWNNPKPFPEELVYPLGGMLIEKIIKASTKEEVIKFLKNQSKENADLIFGKQKMRKIIQNLEEEINRLSN